MMAGWFGETGLDLCLHLRQFSYYASSGIVLTLVLAIFPWVATTALLYMDSIFAKILRWHLIIMSTHYKNNNNNNKKNYE